MLTTTQDNEEIIERVAALDIGKAELMCCVRVPDEDHPGRRLQEVQPYSTMTRSLLGLSEALTRDAHPTLSDLRAAAGSDGEGPGATDNGSGEQTRTGGDFTLRQKDGHSVISSNTHNVHLDSGTQLLLQVKMHGQ